MEIRVRESPRPALGMRTVTDERLKGRRERATVPVHEADEDDR